MGDHCFGVLGVITAGRPGTTAGHTWLVCGGRGFDDREAFEAVMHCLVMSRGMPSKVINGGASGADVMATIWAYIRRVPFVVYPANWSRDGRSAGPVRNQQMLDEGKPALVIAFPGGVGTADMIRRAKAAGVTVVEVSASSTISKGTNDGASASFGGSLKITAREDVVNATG